jgi:hypothetical protein
MIKTSEFKSVLNKIIKRLKGVNWWIKSYLIFSLKEKH